VRTSDIEAGLTRAIEDFEIIDGHEHLGPEEGRTRRNVDAFDLFGSYIRLDLLSAGMSEQDYQSLRDGSLPLERRWSLVEPFYERIRWGSYARVARLSARRFYGVEDISARTLLPLSDAMAKANTPGIYQRVLRGACRIRTALTQCGSTRTGTPLLTPIVSAGYRFSQTDPYPYQFVKTREQFVRPAFAPDATIASLNDYLGTFGEYLARSKAEGAVGLKIAAIATGGPPDRAEALSAAAALLDGRVEELPGVNPLQDYVLDEMVRAATELGLVVAVHSGYWGDFRNVDPLNMIPLIQRQPQARFDLYHLGYPWPRQALTLAKRFPNVHLNFCWTHAISPRCTAAMLDEALDTVPVNKITAFGGDYGHPVEHVYGHLVLARQDVAKALAGRIAGGQMSEAEALGIARRWFYDNTKDLYGLRV
jgi:predicted TIM-barrel fold metal-dependent hydrolase